MAHFPRVSLSTIFLFFFFFNITETSNGEEFLCSSPIIRDGEGERFFNETIDRSISPLLFDFVASDPSRAFQRSAKKLQTLCNFIAARGDSRTSNIIPEKRFCNRERKYANDGNRLGYRDIMGKLIGPRQALCRVRDKRRPIKYDDIHKTHFCPCLIVPSEPLVRYWLSPSIVAPTVHGTFLEYLFSFLLLEYYQQAFCLRRYESMRSLH